MADLSKTRVVAVGGPTASGKTALSVALARAFDGEIINADSMQIYKNLDVGTAKPSAEERQGIPHYLLDFLSPETPYSVADFTAAADPLIRDITARGRLPLVVGGTGLYITSLLSGMAFARKRPTPPSAPDYRRGRTPRAARHFTPSCKGSTPTTPLRSTPTTCRASSAHWSCLKPQVAA